MTPLKDRILLAGVIGWPIHQSRSPMLHNYWFKQHSLNGHYVPLAVKPEDIETALRGLPVLGFSGVNITIPHKQTSMPLMAEIDAVGRGIGAINLVVVRRMARWSAATRTPTAASGTSGRCSRSGCPKPAQWRSSAPAAVAHGDLGAGRRRREGNPHRQPHP